MRVDGDATDKDQESTQHGLHHAPTRILRRGRTGLLQCLDELCASLERLLHIRPYGLVEDRRDTGWKLLDGSGGGDARQQFKGQTRHRAEIVVRRSLRGLWNGAEIHDPHNCLAALSGLDHHVLRFKIQVQHPMTMREVQCRGNLAGCTTGDVCGDLPLRELPAPDVQRPTRREFRKYKNAARSQLAQHRPRGIARVADFTNVMESLQRNDVCMAQCDKPEKTLTNLLQLFGIRHELHGKRTRHDLAEAGSNLLRPEKRRGNPFHHLHDFVEVDVGQRTGHHGFGSRGFDGLQRHFTAYIFS